MTPSYLNEYIVNVLNECLNACFAFYIYLTEERLRSRLLDIDSENGNLRRRVVELENISAARDAELNKFKRRASLLEKEMETLQAKTSMYEQERRDLEREVCNRQTACRSRRDRIWKERFVTD